MSRPLILAVVSTVFLVPPAMADVPGPPHLKHVDPIVCFEGVEQHPEYVFFLRFLTYNGGPSNVPYRLEKISNSNPFNLLSAPRLGNMQLLAMSREEFEKRVEGDSSLAWLNDKTDGVLVANLPTASNTVSILVWQTPVTTYRVTLADGHLSAWLVSETAPAAVLASWAAGLAALLALAWLGIRFARRRRKVIASAAP